MYALCVRCRLNSTSCAANGRCNKPSGGTQSGHRRSESVVSGRASSKGSRRRRSKKSSVLSLATRIANAHNQVTFFVADVSRLQDLTRESERKLAAAKALYVALLAQQEKEQRGVAALENAPSGPFFPNPRGGSGEGGPDGKGSAWTGA